MIKKNFVTIGTALTYLLLLPNISFTETTYNKIDKASGLYVSGKYKPGVSHFRKFSVKETNYDTKQLIGLKHNAISIKNSISRNTNFNTPYKVTFQDDAISFSGAIGYSSSKGQRFEVEGSYEEFDVKNPGDCTIKDTYRYFALARSVDAKGNPDDNKYTVMRNDGLSIASIMFNACYDLHLNNLDISPYICAGIGGDFIEFFNAQHIKFAYQGKLGINYHLSPKISLFANGYYHKTMGRQFKNLNVQYVSDLTDAPKAVSAVATLSIGYFGGEFGVRFVF